jgi:hypothetical protein
MKRHQNQFFIKKMKQKEKKNNKILIFITKN